MHLQFEFFSVYDNRGDLLIHEDKNSGYQSRDDRDEDRVERVLARVDRNEPASLT